MQAILGLLFFCSLAGLWALLRWARRAVVYDVTVIVPCSLPCLAGPARRPSDDWPDEALDRMADALEVPDPDEHEEAGIG